MDRFIRFARDGREAYGRLDNNNVYELKQPPYQAIEPTGRSFPLSEVSLCNDLVDREWLLGDLQWFRAKGADGFGPIGPAIVTEIDYAKLKLETRVNGEVRQSSSTSELVFSPDVLLSYVSQYVTLMPGDVIFTGTPGQTSQVRKGDVIEVEIEHVGTLRNRVAG